MAKCGLGDERKLRVARRLVAATGRRIIIGKQNHHYSPLFPVREPEDLSVKPPFGHGAGGENDVRSSLAATDRVSPAIPAPGSTALEGLEGANWLQRENER